MREEDAVEEDQDLHQHQVVSHHEEVDEEVDDEEHQEVILKVETLDLTLETVNHKQKEDQKVQEQRVVQADEE